MDDWATSSPWAETTQNDDDFDDFQSSLPATTNGQKGAPPAEASAGGGANGFSPFKLNKEPFGNGWGYDGHEPSTTAAAVSGWHQEDDSLFAPKSAGLVPSVEEDDKLKPAKSNWEYKNEWAKSQESLAPSESSNIWNKPDDWGDRDVVVPETKPAPVSTEIHTISEPAPRDDESIPITPSAPVIEVKEEWIESSEPKEDSLPPVIQDEDITDPAPAMLEVKEDTLPPRAKSPFAASDFGDFEEEDDSIEIAPAAVPQEIPSSRPISMDLKSGNLDVDFFPVGNLSALDSIYTTKPRRIPSEANGTEIIQTTSQRKMWYKLIRKESARNSIQGEDVLRVRWSGSDTQQKVHNIVKRWILEDRMSGRTMVGGSGGGMFDWNSTTPGVRSNPISPAQSTFPSFPKPRIDPAKRSSMTGPPVASPRSASFGWSSAQSPKSPQSPTFGWAGTAPTGSEARKSSISQNTRNPIATPFSTAPKQPVTQAMGHKATSSVDIPRSKPVPTSNRPTSMLVEPNSRSLFGELSAIQSPPPPTANIPQPPALNNGGMDFSMFEDKIPAVVPQNQADSSFDDDFGDFEESTFQSPPPAAAPPTTLFSSISPVSTVQTPPVQIQSRGMVSPPASVRPAPPIVSNDSASLLFDTAKTPPTKPTPPPSQLNINHLRQATAKAELDSSEDPWGSFDIFDAPKPEPIHGQVKDASVAALVSPPIQKPPIDIIAPSSLSHTKSPSLSMPPPQKPIQQVVNTSTKPASKDDDEFDDWGEMMDTPTTEQNAVWSTMPPQKPALNSNPHVRPVVRQATLELFDSPAAAPKAKTPSSDLDIFASPVSNTPPKATFSSSFDILGNSMTSVQKQPPPTSMTPPVVPSPAIPSGPTSPMNNMFSSVLVPQRVSTPPLSSLPSSTRNSVDISRKGTPISRNDSFASLSSLALGVKKEEATTIANKRFSTPILPTQLPQAQQVRSQQARPTATPPPMAVSSPLASEWDDADFGFFEEAPNETKPEPIIKPASSTGHRPTASMGNISTSGLAGPLKHASKGSITMSPIVGKKDEGSMFNEIIDLLPDLRYMLK